MLTCQSVEKGDWHLAATPEVTAVYWEPVPIFNRQLCVIEAVVKPLILTADASKSEARITKKPPGHHVSEISEHRGWPDGKGANEFRPNYRARDCEFLQSHSD